MVDVGIVPTPLLYFSVVHWKMDGGAMITGSHNAAEYNGFKLGVGAIDASSATDIQEPAQDNRVARLRPIRRAKAR